MIIAFVVRAIVGAVLLTCAALAAERVAAWFGRSRRWIWAAGMLASLLLPSVSPWIPRFTGHAGIANPSTVIIASLAPPRLPVVAAPSTTLPSLVDSRPPAVPSDSNGVLGEIWLGLSLAMLLWVAFAYARLGRLSTHSVLASVGGQAVRVSGGAGPAVIGVLRPTIVIPRWVVDAPADEQRLIILHEREHIAARDPLLLAFAAAATVVMPWNVLLWWQAARLRLAIETDCDARVLACGTATLQLYGRTLIRTAGDIVALPALAPAWGERTSQLRHRIMAMTAQPPRARFVLATTCAALAVALTLAACEATAPEHSGNNPAPRANAAAQVSTAPHAAAPKATFDTTPSLAFGLPEAGYVRVKGYTREHMPARVLLTGAGARISMDGNAPVVRGDTLELDVVTPAVFRIVTNGAPNYRLVAAATEPGTEVEIQEVAPTGYGYPGASSARGSAPAFNRMRDTTTHPRPPSTPHTDAEPPSSLANYADSASAQYLKPGHLRVDGDAVGPVRFSIRADISFDVVSAAATYAMPDGSVELLTPAEIAIAGTAKYTIIFDPADPTSGLSVAARDRVGGRFGVATAYSGRMTAAARADGTAIAVTRAAGGGIAVCSTPRYSGIRGVDRGAGPSDVRCD